MTNKHASHWVYWVVNVILFRPKSFQCPAVFPLDSVIDQTVWSLEMSLRFLLWAGARRADAGRSRPVSRPLSLDYIHAVVVADLNSVDVGHGDVSSAWCWNLALCCSARHHWWSSTRRCFCELISGAQITFLWGLCETSSGFLFGKWSSDAGRNLRLCFIVWFTADLDWFQTGTNVILQLLQNIMDGIIESVSVHLKDLLSRVNTVEEGRSASGLLMPALGHELPHLVQAFNPAGVDGGQVRSVPQRDPEAHECGLSSFIRLLPCDDGPQQNAVTVDVSGFAGFMVDGLQRFRRHVAQRSSIIILILSASRNAPSHSRQTEICELRGKQSKGELKSQCIMPVSHSKGADNRDYTHFSSNNLIWTQILIFSTVALWI